MLSFFLIDHSFFEVGLKNWHPVFPPILKELFNYSTCLFSRFTNAVDEFLAKDSGE